MKNPRFLVTMVHDAKNRGRCDLKSLGVPEPGDSDNQKTLMICLRCPATDDGRTSELYASSNATAKKWKCLC
jgi:hypothetical protein